MAPQDSKCRITTISQSMAYQCLLQAPGYHGLPSDHENNATIKNLQTQGFCD
ncbi:hypothetical protein PIB30_115664, partial [Stylosanthes scabra]|nr:hypothetical protein [Stylosanthes scabra]